MLPIGAKPFNCAKAKGVVQLICTHRECSDYDKPMEMDLPTVELRSTTDAKILAEVPKPKLVLLN